MGPAEYLIHEIIHDIRNIQIFGAKG